MSLFLNTLSRFAIAFLLKNKHFLFLFFNFMAAVTVCSDCGAQENKICHCFHFFASIYCEMMGPDAVILVYLDVEF